MIRRLLFLLGFIPLAGMSQSPDSVNVLPWVFYMEQVYYHHPVARQLQLQPEMAEAALMTARGAFDPKIKSTYRAKDFKDTNYYQIWDSKLEVPVWNFADLKAGYEQNSGEYLNNEAFVPDDGLVYAGISVPIGRGMFIDSRRAAVQNALLELDATEADRQKNMNKFLLNAAKAYWEWNQAYLQWELATEGVVLAQFRYDGTLEGVTQGASAAIDTLEAGLQLQSRKLDLNQAVLNLQTAQLYMETFLWSPQEEPLQLQPGVIPEPLLPEVAIQPPPSLDSLVALASNHPEFIKYQIKGEQLAVDRRLALENLKPELRLEYNWLWQPGTDIEPVFSNFQNDYKWGGSLEIPIFLRKERGKLTQVNIKLEQNMLEQENTLLRLENEIRQRHLQQSQFDLMYGQATNMSSQYERLLAAERIKFENGESSLFLVNSREVKYLDARRKQIELQAKFGKALAEVWERAGILEVLWLDQVSQ